MHPYVSTPPEVTVAVRNDKAAGAQLPGASSRLLPCLVFILETTGIHLTLVGTKENGDTEGIRPLTEDAIQGKGGMLNLAHLTPEKTVRTSLHYPCLKILSVIGS